MKRGIKPVIPPKSNRTKAIRCSKRLYRERNCIERMFGYLKGQNAGLAFRGENKMAFRKAKSIAAGKREPRPVDKYVGNRVRMRRLMLRMSQTTLGDKLGITFQQVQKYEKGTNRIGSSRLHQIAGICRRLFHSFLMAYRAGRSQMAKSLQRLLCPISSPRPTGSLSQELMYELKTPASGVGSSVLTLGRHLRSAPLETVLRW